MLGPVPTTPNLVVLLRVRVILILSVTLISLATCNASLYFIRALRRYGFYVYLRRIR